MANKITYTAGTNQLPLTASRFTADTSGGNVTLYLPTISQMQNFQERGSGFNVSGTFNYAFEKIGNGQLILNVGIGDDTINGSMSLVVNDIGSGIIFISSDNSWGIVNFSHSNNSVITSKVDASIVQFDASRIDSPIISVPAKAGALILPMFIVVTVVDVVSDGSSPKLSYGYVGNEPIGEIDLTGLVAGSRVIVPIIAPQHYDVKFDPQGLGFGFFRKSGSVAINFAASYIET